MALRFASLNDDQLRAMLTSLVEQLASGVASISINGITTTYSTPANIRAAIVERSRVARRWNDPLPRGGPEAW